MRTGSFLSGLSDSDIAGETFRVLKEEWTVEFRRIKLSEFYIDSL